MADIINNENSISLKIQLLDNDYNDIVKDRTDFENYISFDFKLTVDEKIYSFPDQPTFSLYEIKNLLTNFKKICPPRVEQLNLF